MDTELLVEKQMDDGQRLIDQLVRDEIEVSVGFWVKTSEEGVWRLYLAVPTVNPEIPVEAYRQVFAALGKLSDCSVQLSDLSLLNDAVPVARAAIEVRDRHAGKMPTRYRGKRLGDLAIVEAYIYPPPGQWFPGFDEIKKNFPSAEAFTIPVRFEGAPPIHWNAWIGTVNATTFEDRSPGTVLFVGPKGGRGDALAELCFVYRPEGWNTLYRVDTKRYEAVEQVTTRAPLYRSADYGPLEALKIPRKPAEDLLARSRS